MTTKKEALAGEWINVEAGKIRLVQHMGSDDMIVNINRTSLAKKGARRAETVDAINRMVRHHHNTAIEQAVATFEVVCPKYIAAQWMRHRTASYNELSMRYSEAEELDAIGGFYVPKEWRLQHKTEHQATCDEGVTLNGLPWTFQTLNETAVNTYNHARSLGVCREQARGALPYSFFTRFFVTANLHNWLHFLERRTDWHAQLEIRVFANAIRQILHAIFPCVLDAWGRYRKNSVVLTEPMLRVMPHVIKFFHDMDKNIQDDPYGSDGDRKYLSSGVGLKSAIGAMVISECKELGRSEREEVANTIFNVIIGWEFDSFTALESDDATQEDNEEGEIRST